MSMATTAHAAASIVGVLSEQLGEARSLMSDLAGDLESLGQALAASEQAAEAYRQALSLLVARVHETCSFDAGETCPEDAAWAAALDRLDDATNELVDGLAAKGLWC